MTQVGTPRFETIRAAVRMTEEACRLPAVATLDWLDRAAAVLRGVVSPSRTCILIANISGGSRTLSLEAAGYAGVASGESGDESNTELTVRSRAERLTDLEHHRRVRPVGRRLEHELAEHGDDRWRRADLFGGFA